MWDRGWEERSLSTGRHRKAPEGLQRKSPTVLTAGRLYAKLHRVDTAWFQPITQQLIDGGELTHEESDWACCLWLLRRLLRTLGATETASSIGPEVPYPRPTGTS